MSRRSSARSALALATLALVLAATGCGKSGHPTSASSSGPTTPPANSPTVSAEPTSAATSAAPPSRTAVDPCSLIEKEEADQLAGVILQDPQKAGPAGQPAVRCVWPTPLSGPIGQVELDVGDGAKKFMDIEVMLNHQLDPVPGLADEAVVEDGTIFFRSGETWVAIHLVGGPSGEASHEPLKAVAAKVLSRL